MTTTAIAVKPEGCVGEMTPERAIYFLERFKRDEKMLGPHEQWALDFAIAALTPHGEEAAGPVPESHVRGPDFRSLLQNLMENDGGEGSKGYDARLYMDARKAALAALASEASE